MTRYDDLPYRTCVGMMLVNAAGLVFIGRRAGGPEHVDETHVWQMPQGGVDPGEDTWEAAKRELFEETSVRSVEKIGEVADWLIYDIPGAPGKVVTAASARSGTRSASPARIPRSTCSAPATATSRNSSSGDGSRCKISPT